MFAVLFCRVPTFEASVMMIFILLGSAARLSIRQCSAVMFGLQRALDFSSERGMHGYCVSGVVKRKRRASFGHIWMTSRCIVVAEHCAVNRQNCLSMGVCRDG